MKRGKPLKRSSKPLKKTPLRRSRIKSGEEKEQEQYDKEKMNVFWLYCASNLRHRSDISKRWISGIGKVNFHHAYEKGAHPDLKYSIDVILVVTWEEHQNLNSDLEYYPEAVDKQEWIREHWKDCAEQSREWSEEYDILKRR